MRPTNLLALSEGFAAVPAERLAAYEARLSERVEPLRLREHEVSAVVELAHSLLAQGMDDPRAYEGFVFSFTIPQISREFDLLRISRRMVVDVELKSENVGMARIARQLERTRYYLSPLGRAIHTFTFVTSTGAVFERDARGEVRLVDMGRLAQVLSAVDEPYTGLVEDLFQVQNYLVSPLNDTDKFLQGEYFLTNQQEMIKADCLERLAHATDGEPPAFVVYGSAGTGKSLLLYDLARSLGGTHSVRVIHCGNLCEGHRELNRMQDGFCVMPARKSERVPLDACDVLLVDEAQRMWTDQLRAVAGAAAGRGIPLYLSLDRRQVLSDQVARRDAEKLVREAFCQVHTYELSRRIRTNRELAGFIRTLFGLKGHAATARTNNVKVCYAADAQRAARLVASFRAQGYQYVTIPGPAPLAFPGCPNAYDVVGQEFDKVVMAAGPDVALGEGGRTVASPALFQGLTRARGNIALVAYDNPALIDLLLSIA